MNSIQQPDFKALMLALYYYCGDKVKYGLLSNNLFQKKQTTWQLRKLQGFNKLL